MTELDFYLKLFPCLDTDEMAASRRQELDSPQNVAAALGRSAVEAAKVGYYLDTKGRKVHWSEAVHAACEAKRSIAPDDQLPNREFRTFAETRVQVTNETALGVSLRLVENGMRPLALNFANGIHPGGGFLGGARAQEEVLCRSSALYMTLVGDPMYAEHRKRPRPDSSDWAIYSPDVPVFRKDDGTPLDRPWLLSFITCAAPYAPAIGQPEAGDLLQLRIHRMLAIAQAFSHAVLVLGAWGCGAFANDPSRTARNFRQALENDFRGAFSDIVFAITDWSPERRFLGPFRDVFSLIDDDIEFVSRDRPELPAPPDDAAVQAILDRLSRGGIGIKLKNTGADLQQIAYLIAQVKYKDMLWDKANDDKAKVKAAARDHLKKIKMRQQASLKYNREKHLRSLVTPIVRRQLASTDSVRLKHSRSKYKPHLNLFLLYLWAVLRKHTPHPYSLIAALIHSFDLYDKGHCKPQAGKRGKGQRKNCPHFRNNGCTKPNPFAKPCFETTRHRVYQRIRNARNKNPNLVERLDDPLNQI
jgi:uncharacterized protein (TIGR02452 family)